MASRADVERAAGEIVERFGRVDVLVNNAGTCIHRPALEVTEEEWDEVIDVNLTGVWNGCQVFGTAHGGRRRRGRSSTSARCRRTIVNRPQWQPAYNASKAAVHHLTRSLAAEWAPLGVRVNAVAPGYVRDRDDADRPAGVQAALDRRRAAAAGGGAGGDRPRGPVPGQPRVRLHDRLDPHDRRRLLRSDPHPATGRTAALRTGTVRIRAARCVRSQEGGTAEGGVRTASGAAGAGPAAARATARGAASRCRAGARPARAAGPRCWRGRAAGWRRAAGCRRRRSTPRACRRRSVPRVRS